MARSTAGSRTATPSGQNLLINSEDLTSVSWISAGLTMVANSTIAPDGTLTADSWVETAATSGHGRYYNVGLAALPRDLKRTYSIYVKALGGTPYVQFGDSANGQFGGFIVDLATGAVTQNSASLTYKIEDALNGFWRISVTLTTAIQVAWFVGSCLTSTAGSAYGDNHVGSITRGLYVWGAQVVNANWAGPYVKTAGTAINTGSIRSLSARRKAVVHIPWALNFQASNCGVAIPNTANLTPGTSSFSVATWLNASADPAGDHFVGYNSPSYAAGWLLARGAPNSLIVYVKSGGPSATFANFFAGRKGRYVRVFVTFSSVDYKVRAYRDGVLFGTSAAITAWDITATGTAHMGLTAELSAGTTGLQTDVSFYKGTVPTDAQVADDYFENIQAPNCVHRYKFEAGSGTTYVDSIAGNTAAFFNVAPTWTTDSPGKSRTTA